MTTSIDSPARARPANTPAARPGLQGWLDTLRSTLAKPLTPYYLLLVIGTQSSLGVTVNGNRNWLALGPLQVQPAEIAKFSLIIWCAHIYAKKE